LLLVVHLELSAEPADEIFDTPPLPPPPPVKDRRRAEHRRCRRQFATAQRVPTLILSNFKDSFVIFQARKHAQRNKAPSK